MDLLRRSGLCFLFLCLSQNISLGCKWIQNGEYKHKSSFSLTLLKDMGEKDMSEDVNISIPEELYKLHSKSEIDNKISILHTALGQILKFYKKSEKRTTWDKDQLNQFMSLLHRQKLELNHCKTKGGCVGCKELKQYFKNLKRFLRSQKNSALAWEIIRKKVMDNLIRMELLASHIKNPPAI
ncbi:interferon a3-like [Acipenser ruthenus]|uniref:IFNe2 n=1 Tax=Acipenser ruthenus TaxID=7906 RepID=A0AAU7N2U1_ACIRT|nr:interferon a3-like [Acipenser ruthenus]